MFKNFSKYLEFYFLKNLSFHILKIIFLYTQNYVDNDCFTKFCGGGGI
jgi:hypothetical protein